MNSDIRQFIGQAKFHRALVGHMAEMLPADDAELDSWIAEAVHENDMMANLDLSEELLLASDDPAKSLRLIQEAALKGLQTEDTEEFADLAYAVTFSKFSALGILLYRGVIPLLEPGQAVDCYEQVLIARDRLSLSPDDPSNGQKYSGIVTSVQPIHPCPQPGPPRRCQPCRYCLTPILG